jgi:CheY-like chemotaxis protein
VERVADTAGVPLVLFVDDEPLILRAVTRMMRKTSHQTAQADSLANAIAILEREPVACVVSDFRMPNANGLEVLEATMRLRPSCGRLLMTGQADPAALEQGLASGLIQAVLWKPFSEAELVAAVASAIANRRL